MARLALAVGLILLTGCAGGPRPEVALAPHLSFTMPSPAALGREIDVVQQVIAQYRAQTTSFQARLSVTPQRLTLVVLDSLGRRGLTLVWDGKTVQSELAPWLPPAIRPENMLADIGLIYWPEAAVRDGLAGPSVVLHADKTGRSITKAGSEAIHIDYGTSTGPAWTGTAHLHNLALGYSLDIESQEVEP